MQDHSGANVLARLVHDSAIIKLTRGLNVKLLGSAPLVLLDLPVAATFAVRPMDVPGLESIPRLLHQVGDSVLAGDPVLASKANPEVVFSSPVSGDIVEVRRGPKRAITEVVIEPGRQLVFRAFRKPSLASRDQILETLLGSGAWTLLRQRPFNTFADPAVTPRDIFVSCFDSAPLAPDTGFLLQGREEAFLAGLRALRTLTSGEVHLGVAPHSSDLFRRADSARVHTFDGPHPAGAVGVQIHHIAPIAKGHVVWTIKPQDVAIIGTLVTEGIFDARRTVAFTGPQLTRTGYVDTRLGAAVAPFLAGNLKSERVRLISGNVLTGKIVPPSGHLGHFDDQVTVIEEGDQPEFLGWLFPSYPRPTLSRTFLSYFLPNREYAVNSNPHGEQRAFVMTGEYERVVPMDLYPQHLLKAILFRDFDQMEGLGIYEVVEEDLALCEFACTSKQPVQRILREGLDWMRGEA